MILHLFVVAFAFHGTLSARIGMDQADQELYAETDDPFGFLEQWLTTDSNEEQGRVRRDILETLGVTQLLNNPNVALILKAIASLAKDALNFIECCEPVVSVPPALAETLIQCVNEPMSKLTAYANTTQEVDSEFIENLLEKETCTARCAFKKLKMVSSNGLPSSEAMSAALTDLATTQQMEMLQPALQTCNQQTNNTKGSALTEAEICSATNLMLSCIQRVVLEGCPENQKKRGAVCLVRLTKGFIQALPSKARELKNDIFNGILGFISSILTPKSK